MEIINKWLRFQSSDERERVEAPSKKYDKYLHKFFLFGTIFLLFLAFSISIITISPKIARADITTGLVGYWPLDNGSGTSVSDLSISENTGTLTGVIKPAWVTGVRGSALNFVGSDAEDYVQLSADNNKFPDENGDWTISTWINLNNSTAFYDGGLVFGSSGSGFFVGEPGIGNSILFLSNDAVTKKVTVPINIWHHISLVKSGSSKNIYLNGVASTSSFGPDSGFSSISNRNRIGWGHGGHNLDARLDELRIYNRALTLSDIAELYGISFSPTLSTIDATSVTEAAALLRGQITEANLASSTSRGFVYSTSATFSSNVSTSSENGLFGSGIFSLNISGLSASTTYYFKSFASNSTSTGYGGVQSFNTEQTAPSAPIVITEPANSITHNSAILNADITSGQNISQYGFAYSTDPLLVSNTSTTTMGSKSDIGPFQYNISGLSINTTYYFRAYAVNFIGTSTGSILSLTIPATSLPLVTMSASSASSSVTKTTAILSATTTNDGNSSILIRGFNYGTTTSYDYTASTTGNYGAGPFSVQINNLSCSTTYHFQAFVTNSLGTGTSSPDLTFETVNCSTITLPGVSSSEATSITSTSSTLNAQIEDTGSDNITVRGFEYGLTTSYGTRVSTSTSSTFEVGPFSANLTGIACNTTYHFRSYVTNSAGTSSSTDRTFTTLGDDQSCGKVHYTYNQYGLQTLQYNGQIYNRAPPGSTHDMIFPTFQSPSTGTTTLYAYGPTTSAGASIRTTGSGPDYVQQVYRNGLQDSFTLKWVFDSPDNNTFKVDTYITNNDSAETITKVSMRDFFSFMTPGPVLSEIPYLGANFSVARDSVSSFVRGSWGSAVLYTDDYTKGWHFGSATNNFPSSDGKDWFLISLTNNYTQGTTSNMYIEPIAPGQTGHYTFYIRFGSPTDTARSLAPEAYSLFRDTYPYLVNWPDRAPIALWYIGDGASNSANNPRSYLNDNQSGILTDVFPLTPEKQAIFNSRILGMADSIITRMNNMNPRPQGIQIWDLEGDEFEHYFTYVGNPNKLPEIAPEMDAVADQMFQKFKDAGYKLGITLRPSDFQTGLTADLPTTCFSHPTNHDLNDIYIATDGTYPFRGYSCKTPNTWVNNGFANPERGRWPYYQHASHDDEVLFNTLRSKVAYAKNRWGVSMFYVDSTVYSNNGGGTSINFSVFRRLQEEFPDVIFFPENTYTPYSGTSAVYGASRLGLGGEYLDTSQEARNIYPEAFSAITPIDSDLVGLHDRFVNTVKNGNIFFVDGQWNNPDNAKILQIYNDAGYSDAPNISIQSPVDNTTISGAATLIASSTTYLNLGIAGIQFKLDNSINIGSEITSTSSQNTYSVSWDSNTVSNGSHTITAIARDYIGNYSSTTINITVNNLASVNANPPTPTPYYSSGGGSSSGSASVQSQINSLLTRGQYTLAQRLAEQYGIAIPTNPAPQATTTPKVTIPSFTRTLKLGMTGNDVKQLQVFLNTQGFTVAKNGYGSRGHETTYFGPATRASLMRFQLAYKKDILTPQGLTSPTGFFGVATMKVMNGMVK